jgi:hypothetical protein
MADVATSSQSADERMAVAFHEAGHAVVARALGSKVVTVEIEPEPCANCLHPRGTTNAAVVALAGDQAERRAVPESEGSAEVDFRTARDVAERLAPMIATELLESFRDQARALLDAQWPDVVSIAGALIARGRLTGAEIDLLIHQRRRP